IALSALEKPCDSGVLGSGDPPISAHYDMADLGPLRKFPKCAREVGAVAIVDQQHLALRACDRQVPLQCEEVGGVGDHNKPGILPESAARRGGRAIGHGRPSTCEEASAGPPDRTRESAATNIMARDASNRR